jgi:hypothetical protein
MNNIIYGLHSGDGIIRYVGLTRTGFQRRWYIHRASFKSGKYAHLPIYRWIAKVGLDNVQHIVLEELDTPERLPEREVYWINQFDNLLNCATGGYGGDMGPVGRAQVSAKSKGKPKSPEHAAKLAIGLAAGRVKMSADPKYQEMRVLASAKGVHVRHHKNKGIVKDGCALCKVGD